MNNRAKTIKTIHKTPWWPARWLVPLVSLPVLMGIVAVMWLSYRELRAAQSLQPLTESLNWGGAAQGAAGPEKAFRDSTSTEATAEWSRIYFLLETDALNPTVELPIMGNGPLPPVLDPAQPWEADASVGEYLTEMQPVIELIHHAAAEPTPVWQPIAFQGFGTLLPHLQAAREPAQLLQLEAEYALYHGDSQRRLAAITALQGTAQSVDWDIFIVAQLVHISLQDIHLKTIQRSLQTDIWNAEQLEQLMSQIDQPIAVAETYRKGLASQQAWVSSILESEFDLFPGMRLVKFPSAKLELLRQYDELEEVSHRGTGRLSTRVSDYEEKWLSLRGGTGALAGQLLGTLTSYAVSIEITEQWRQLTLVALGLKRFQLEYERWPQELAELTKVGLSSSEWTVVGLGPLGYSAEEKLAYVWGLQRGNTGIAPQRPSVDIEKLDEAYHVTIVSLDTQPQ